MRTLVQYVPQCEDRTISPKNICDGAPTNFFTPRGRTWVWNVVSVQYGMCEKTDYGLSPSFTMFEEILGLLLTVHHLKCTYTFPAEVGDYDITIVANTTTNDSVIQKFRIKV